MNKMMLYVFPIGVVVGAPFLPLAVLLYWVSNNLWTLGQQYVVYKKIDAEESEKKAQIVADRQARAPRPGQKPVKPEPVQPEVVQPEKTPGAKPTTRRTGSTTNGKASTGGAVVNGSTANGAGTNGAVTRPPARRPRKRR
jgi:YidC/Oxa1 family membrane protein insertase